MSCLTKLAFPVDHWGRSPIYPTKPVPMGRRELRGWPKPCSPRLKGREACGWTNGLENPDP